MKKTRLLYGALLMLTWIILTWSLNPYQLLLGAASCLIVALFTYGLIPESARLFMTPLAAPVLFWYVVLLSSDMLKTNVFIAGRLLRPEPDTAPGLVTFQLSMDNPLAVAILANTLSLIHDTAVVSLGSRPGELLVSCTSAPNADGSALIAQRIDKYQKLLGKLS